MKKTEKLAWAGAALGSGLIALLSPDTIESFIKHMSDASQTQFTKNVFIFSLAAVIHSGRMKKEIRTNFESLIASIDSVSAALRAEMKTQNAKIDGLTVKVEAHSHEINKLKQLQGDKV